MLSAQQFEEKKEKVRKVVTTFLKGNYTINEVAKMTDISSSSVQRYLNDEEFISMCFGSNAPIILTDIKDRLEQNKQEGLSRGGVNSTFNNVSFRDEMGHYNGSRKIC